MIDFKNIPLLNPDASMKGLDLTPEDAFVLSRVNGKASIADIQKMIGFNQEKVTAIFEKLLQAKLISFKTNQESQDSSRTDKKITSTIQQRIRQKYEFLEKKQYFELLEVSRTISAEELENAYFKLSKEFHPDRFFKEPLGPFKKMLEEVFSGIQQAYETLKDPELKRQYLNILRKPKFYTKVGSREPAEKPGRSLKNVEVTISSGQSQYDMGKKEEEKGNLKASLNFYKMALMLDPKNKTFSEAISRVQKQIKDNPLKSL